MRRLLNLPGEGKLQEASGLIAFVDSRFMAPQYLEDMWHDHGFSVTGTLNSNRVGTPRKEIAKIAASLKRGP